MKVRPPTITTVAQAMTLNARLFVYFPMIRLLFTSNEHQNQDERQQHAVSTWE